MISLTTAVFSRAETDELDEICRSQPAYWRLSGDADPGTMTRDSVEAMLRADAAADGCETLVARDGTGRVVGFVQLLLRHPVSGRPWIGLLMVDGRLGRRGYGRDIVAAVEERFRSGGAAAVELGVLVANEAARSFWERLGYRAIDVRPDRDMGRPTAVLEKPL
jgi:RimJ/RimL family protein N-acetyltransferase